MPIWCLGRILRKVAKSGETEVVVAVGGRFKANAAEVQSIVEAFLKTYSGSVQRCTPKGRMLFVANPYGDPGRLGVVVYRGRSISVLVGGKLDEASKRFWVPLVGHEVFHILNGTAIQFKVGKNIGSVKGSLSTIHTLPPHASVLPPKAIFLQKSGARLRIVSVPTG